MVLAFAMWLRGEKEHEKMENLCMTSARMAWQSFEEYASTGDNAEFWYGVGDFRSFMTAYLYLNDNEADPNYLYCNEVYGWMVLNPDKVKEDMHVLNSALWILSEDYTDPNGYNLMSVLANVLKHG